MARQEKTAKIYFVLLALTVAFLCALLLEAKQNRQILMGTQYTVETERAINARTIPERKYININTATAQELEALPGIGPALSQAIVAYRDEHGAFTWAEDLLNVKGIGEAKLDAIREEITFGNGGEE